MKPRDYKYKNLRPLDVLCIASKSLLASLIRLTTAKLVGRDGKKEFRFEKTTICNHTAMIVKLGDKYWLAEMEAGGLHISSMRKYLRDPKEKIVAVRRHTAFYDDDTMKKGNTILTELAHYLRDYDYKLVREYLGLGHDDPKKFYCSELCEYIANRCDVTWDKWNLKHQREGKTLIAPVEIQFGIDSDCYNVDDIYAF